MICTTFRYSVRGANVCSRVVVRDATLILPIDSSRMGCGSSSPAVKDPPAHAPVSATKQADPAPRAVPRKKAPDAMLEPYWEYLQPLGKGGSGDTGLFRDLSGGEEVAIKLIKRPLPRVVMPNILREISVSTTAGSVCHGLMTHIQMTGCNPIWLTPHPATVRSL